MPNFKIENIFTVTERGKFIGVRQMDEEKGWSIEKGSKLADFELKVYFDVPRKLDKNGNLETGFYMMKLKYEEDYDKIKEGDVLPLN